MKTATNATLTGIILLVISIFTMLGTPTILNVIMWATLFLTGSAWMMIGITLSTKETK